MKKLLPAAALVAFCLAAASTANARGGWDGNGLSVSGFDMCSLSNAQCAESLGTSVADESPLAQVDQPEVADAPSSEFELISVPLGK